MEENKKSNEEVSLKVGVFDSGKLKEHHENQREYSNRCEDYVEEHFSFPINYDAELAKLLEKTGGRCSFYFKQGPLTQGHFLSQTEDVAKKIQKLGYGTRLKYESEEPGLGVLEENPDQGLIAKLDVVKSLF